MVPAGIVPRMRRWACPVTVIVMLSLLVVRPSCIVRGDGPRQGPTPTLLLVRVAPSTPLEFVTIQNVSNQTVDASGGPIDDGEGWIRINATIPLRPGERLSLMSRPIPAFTSYYPDESVGRLPRVNDGNTRKSRPGGQGGPGEPHQHQGEMMADSFCYRCGHSISGVVGNAIRSPAQRGHGRARPRHSGYRYRLDWFRSCAGRSELAVTSYGASVDPFTCSRGCTGPDDQGDRVRAESIARLRL